MTNNSSFEAWWNKQDSLDVSVSLEDCRKECQKAFEAGFQAGKNDRFYKPKMQNEAFIEALKTKPMRNEDHNEGTSGQVLTHDGWKKINDLP